MRILFSVLLLFSLFACTKDLAYDISYEGDKLVLRGTISEQGVIVKLTYSLAPTIERLAIDSEPIIPNASVELLEEGQVIFSLEYCGSGIYKSKDFIPNTNRRYSIRASAKDYPPIVSSEVKLPEVINLDITLEPQKINTQTGLLQLRFQDPVAISSYYDLQILGFHSSEGVLDDLEFSLIDDVIEEEREGSCNFKFLYNQREYLTFLFPDICFSDKLYTLNLSILLYSRWENVNNELINGIVPDYLDIEFRHLDSNIYNYFSTINNLSGLDWAFTEPAISISNIEGGFGYFGAFGTNKVRIKI